MCKGTLQPLCGEQQGPPGAAEVPQVGVMSCQPRGHVCVHERVKVGTSLLSSILAMSPEGSAAWQALDP